MALPKEVSYILSTHCQWLTTACNTGWCFLNSGNFHVYSTEKLIQEGMHTHNFTNLNLKRMKCEFIQNMNTEWKEMSPWAKTLLGTISQIQWWCGKGFCIIAGLRYESSYKNKLSEHRRHKIFKSSFTK